ncbi:2-oxoacid:ferredoxin oxidoreductase subunit alpha [Cuniculiplasma sp. SKW4]|uniref:2-oxoacid:ferredoxin oxidoreductase subunit alpha n=2 Tax=unclassified Cuniculiplasma TaxID=2619706 RepID=UPI003FCF014B
MMKKIDINITVGGPQGGGIDTSSNMISRAFAQSGYYVFGVREYHSNIKGRHSYTHVRIKSERPRSLKYPVDFLVALDPDSIFEHLEDIGPGTKIIYDSSIEKAELSQARMIMRDTARKIKETLDEEKFPNTIAGAVQWMKSKGAVPLSIPFNNVVQDAIKEGVPSRYFNTLGAALTLAIAGVDRKYMEESIRLVFAGKDKIIEENVRVVDAAYNYCRNNGLLGETLPYIEHSKRFMITGNDGAAIGKIMGGLRMQTYYPITPASDESTIMEEHNYIKWIDAEASKLKDAGVVVVQTEDEISAATMASGAAVTGTRAATATSGPGFSLMAEAIGFAGIDEIPLVITLYQRGGPSTGLPTRNGQSDLLFAMNTGHGEFPRIVLSSGDVEECIYDSMKALNYAQRYQMPVLHLIDKNLANTTDFVSLIDPKKVPVMAQKLEPHGTNFKRYNLDTKNGISNLGAFGKDIFWMTGDEHDELGHVTEDSDIRDRMMEKRFKKLETADLEIPLEDKAILYGDPKAEITFVTWGSQKGPILDVIDLLKEEGINANLLYLRMFIPFPTKFVKEVLSKAKIIIDVESNYIGQAASVIMANTGINIENRILKYNGRHMTEDEIYQSAIEIIKNKGNKIEKVLKHGA